MEHVQFTEDKMFSNKKGSQESKVPQRGIEGWLYKKIPGSPIVKKIILFSIILILFALSIFIIVSARTEEVIEGKANFQERVKATRIR